MKASESCACGASSTARCNVCARGICGQCDAVAIALEAPDTAVPTRGFGYVGDGYSAQMVVGRRVRRELYFGTRLPIVKLLWLIGDAQGRSVHHVCLECLANAVPEAATWIANRAVCHEPICVSPAVRECRRCQTARCEAHRLSAPDWSRLNIRLAYHPSYGAWPGDYVRVPAPSDLCALCLHETELTLSYACSQKHPHMHKSNQIFSVPVPRRASERRRRQERLKWLAVAELHATDWGEQWNGLVSTPPPDRATDFAAGRCYLTADEGYIALPDTIEVREISGVWTILDARQRERPAARDSYLA